MKTVRVIYTTKAEFAETNCINIRAVISELKALGHPGIKYSTYLLQDKKTFMHFDQFEDQHAHDILTGLSSFKKFDRDLFNSGLEVDPVLEELHLVGSTEPFFGAAGEPEIA
jgi:hypothetical protein